MENITVKDFGSNLQIFVNDDCVANYGSDGLSEYTFDENMEGFRDYLSGCDISKTATNEIMQDETAKRWIYFHSSDVK